MKPSKYLNDPQMLRLVEAMESGELTREQAANKAGVSLATFTSQLRRGKHLERLKAVRRYDGDHLFKPDPDKAAVYDKAVGEALANPRLKGTKLLERYPELSYQMLLRRLKAAREGLKESQKVELEREIIEACTPAPAQ